MIPIDIHHLVDWGNESEHFNLPLIFHSFLINNETATYAFNNITFYKLWFNIIYKDSVYITLKRHTYYSETTVVV